MDRNRATERARRCFAVARSTTHEGEREAAINRGLAICEKAGLYPDRFDIPGREKSHEWRSRMGIDEAAYTLAMADLHPVDGLQIFTLDDVLKEAVSEYMRRRESRR